MPDLHRVEVKTTFCGKSMIKSGTTFAIAIACACCVLCAGCYESKYPLTPPGAPLDPRLVGHWIEQPQSPAEAGPKIRRASIFKFSEREYLAVFSTGDESAAVARAFISTFDGVNVLNLQGIDSLDRANRTYVFFKFGFEPDGALEIRIISSDSPLLKNRVFSSQREFSAWVKKNIRDERLFGDAIRFKPATGMDIKLFP